MKKRIFRKYQYGGPSPLLTAVGARQATGDTSDKNALPYFLPIVGTYLTFKDGNPGLGLLSTLGDLGTIGLLGGAFKTARATNQASKAARAAEAAVQAERTAATLAAIQTAAYTDRITKILPTLMRAITNSRRLNIDYKPAEKAYDLLVNKKKAALAARLQAEQNLVGRKDPLLRVINDMFTPFLDLLPKVNQGGSPLYYITPLSYINDYLGKMPFTKESLMGQAKAAQAIEAAAVEASKDLSPYVGAAQTHLYPHILDYVGSGAK